ncbi:MAG: PfkB family carbohydrate kinase [Solobacterium sp.]|jgi:pseudouridine kinase|nr:PfkB family carbohydrate kinase [Solobacterium sp.]MCH4223305.1 PfkB family carbohydrate kinase [Solobacterium sp.]
MSKICVFGGANVDICGSSIKPLRNYDSNPGTIEIRFGGVGRNIAQICAMLKQRVQLVTCFSDDSYGRELKRDCEALGMDCSKAVIVKDLPSSIYIAILDDNRDMKIAMSDMRILRNLDQTAIDEALKDIHPDDMIILDANLSEETLTYIASHALCATAADPVSANKAKRLEPILKQLTVFKPNQYEAQELTGIWIKDDQTAVDSLNWFLDHGVQEIIISMADRGILLGTKDQKVWLTHRTIKLDNATGGGDTFMGAYLAQRLEQASPLQAAEYAAAAAVITIEDNAVQRRSLTDETIRSRIGEMKIKERVL